MDCVSSEGKIVHISLLTHVDKIKKIEELFSSNRHKADLFLPDETFYGEAVSASDPERMAKILFRWFGIKHRSVQFHINPEQEQLVVYTHKKNESQISLGWHTLEDPLVCAAAVAHGIIHHLLIARAKISLGDSDEDEALTDLGTIYAGLGILILNGLSSKQLPLGSMGIQNYASEFIDYCNDQRVVKSIWQPYILPEIASTYLASNTPLKRLKPFIRLRTYRVRSRKKKLAIGLAAVVLLVVSAALFSTTKTKYLSAEMQEKRDSIAILKTQYEQCLGVIAYKQQRWDNSDIFIQRQIEADKTRCTSLKNRYNYEVSEYNAQL
jgi:hypothetical protein